jgi:tRNA dimethylallyltransferase
MTAAARQQPDLLVVVGPTASGKSDFALALAEALGGEIISADSVQVYRRFDIGANKPGAEERARISHHLIDIADPLEPMDAARWATLAEQAIAAILARAKQPIVCGGTFLWVRALLYGLAAAPPADEAVRARHLERAERDGRAALHAELTTVDPEAAERLAPNDFVRVSRALEVYELTGVPLSRWQRDHGFREQRFHARLFGVQHPREEYEQRIVARARRMLEAGLVDEVRTLLGEGYGPARAMSSVGYKQVAAALQASSSIDERGLVEAIVRATRVFARRQRTWLRDQSVTWLSPEQASEGRISAAGLVSDPTSPLELRR